MNSTDCVFCKIVNGQIPSTIIAESDHVIVIKDIAPKTPIHYLIIPKKHIQDIQSLHENDQAIAAELLFMAQRLSKRSPEASNFKLVSNNGAPAGQRVFHLHFHFLAGPGLREF